MYIQASGNYIIQERLLYYLVLNARPKSRVPTLADYNLKNKWQKSYSPLYSQMILATRIQEKRNVIVGRVRFWGKSPGKSSVWQVSTVVDTNHAKNVNDKPINIIHIIIVDW